MSKYIVWVRHSYAGYIPKKFNDMKGAIEYYHDAIFQNDSSIFDIRLTKEISNEEINQQNDFNSAMDLIIDMAENQKTLDCDIAAIVNDRWMDLIGD